MKVFKVPAVFQALDKINEPLRRMFKGVKDFVRKSEDEMARFQRKWRAIGDNAQSIAKKSAIMGLALAAPLLLAARDAIAFEDRMADVAKTTGLAGKELQVFGEQLLALSPDTRTPIEELQQIAAIGGQMGIAKGDLLGFTEAVNKFNVALGTDFSGGVDEAARAIGGLRVLFKETRGLDVADAITRTGSAINALSAKGAVVPEVTEFVKRVGQLPDAIKPSVQDVAALAAVFNKTGITAEIASRGMGDVLLTGAQNLGKFAKVMKISKDEASELINTDPTAFLAKFAGSFKGMSAEKLSATLKQMKVGDIGAIKVVGALSSSLEMLSEFQQISNDEFARGTSILDEYNVKNNTTKAQIEKAINNLKALSITIGTMLLPAINDMVKMIAPAIKGFAQWTRNNPGTVKAILVLIASLSALSFVVSGVATAIAAYAQVMLLVSHWGKVVTAVQWAWNAAMAANPIGLVIVAIAALIALITIVVKKWDEWGAAVSTLMGPLGTMLQIVMAITRNWDYIERAFSEGGILKGIKAIGVVLVESFLMPIEQVLSIISKFTDSEFIANALKGVQGMRKVLELEMNRENKATNPAKSQTEAVSKSIEEKRQTVGIDINDKTGRASMQNDNALGIPINLTSTLGFY